MLFASVSLAARIERAECRLLTASAEAVRRRRAADVMVRSIAGGVATWTSAGSPLNKVVGLGFHGPVEHDVLESLERELERRGSPLRVELSSLADPSVGALLSRRGYALIAFENVLGRALPAEAPARATPGIEIAHGREEDFEVWLDVVVIGFATPDTQGVPSHESYPRELLERVVRDMAGAKGFFRYLATRDGVPAGGASMRLCEGVAQLCGSATLPAHRRRGVQSSLLAFRLAEASRAGCDVAVVTTQPGSKSQENIQHQGFELLYTRAVLVRGD